MKTRKPHGFRSIFKRVLTGYLLLATVVLALTGAVSFALVRRYVVRYNKTDLLEKARIVSGMIAKPGGKTRVLSIDRLIELQDLVNARFLYVGTDMVARRLPTRPHLRGNDAQAGIDSDFEFINIAGSLDEQLLRSLLDGNTATDVRRLDFMEDVVVFAGAPVHDAENNIAGAVILYRPLSDISATSTGILSSISVAGLCAVICALLLAWALSRKMTRPIVALNDSARRMSNGLYGERVALPYRDEIGQLGGTLNLLSERLGDVIGRLQEEKNKLEMILSSIGEGIVAIDADGRIVHHNNAALSILEAPDAAALAAPDASLEHLRRLMDALGEAVRDGEKRRLTWTTPTGRTIETLLSPVTSSDGGGNAGAVGLIRDVSEAQRLEQMRRDYIANISHELRTPLTGIRGMTEPLIDGFIDTEEEKQSCYRVIFQETLRLEKLIGEMLDMSRLQDGRIRLELEELEPEGLLEAARRRVAVRAQEGGVALRIETDEPGVTAMGDEDRILQLLTILLDNALSFTPPGGVVTIFCHKRNGRVELGVSDTGSGIDPVDLPYIWERFYKADRSRMRTTGTGLGLAIAKLVAQLLGGEIWVETEKGKGATFTFTLRLPHTQ